MMTPHGRRPPMFHLALPGWSMLFPERTFAAPMGPWTWAWLACILLLGPFLSDAAACVKLHEILQTDAIMIPSEAARKALWAYRAFRPLVGPLLSSLQWVLLTALLQSRLRREGVGLSWIPLFKIMGIVATPIWIKHILAAFVRLHAESLQDLSLWPTNLLSLDPVVRYTNWQRILLERLDVMDLWALLQMRVALVQAFGLDRRQIRCATRFVIGIVIARDLAVLGLVRLLTSIPVLEALISVMRGALEALYHS